MSKLYHPVLPDKISVNVYPFHRFFYGKKFQLLSEFT